MPADSVTDDKPKQFLGLSGTQTIGSALAAVTSAFVGSFLGVAGTLIGAALGSIIATVGAALYARTLSSAATMALTKMPQRNRNRTLPDDGDFTAADAAPASYNFQREPAGQRFTTRTWIKLGAVSAAAFVLAMVGLTAVEFGTNQPISSLVSATSSIDDGAAKHTTTLGKALTGTPTNSGEADNSSDNEGQVPTQVEGGITADDDTASNSTPNGGDSSPLVTEQPAANETSDTPSDITSESDQSQEPAPETGKNSEPEVLSDSGAVEQPGD
ncbi:PrgI family protein [Pseudarthrobacter sp. NamE2]|uniref:PrgI family protein n=1 Tax=Pseudarthrobacter sp. NamE2 TaxID=2576838 RepID=UPI0010FE90F2|nr:PrgI family protein [Pseudarthrobacter sp. NamE2]TLM84528.1 PrgI family protein [Pseudarthrobacter sp. NamE2]